MNCKTILYIVIYSFLMKLIFISNYFKVNRTGKDIGIQTVKKFISLKFLNALRVENNFAHIDSVFIAIIKVRY